MVLILVVLKDKTAYEIETIHPVPY